jgi:hypothetical protein
MHIPPHKTLDYCSHGSDLLQIDSNIFPITDLLFIQPWFCQQNRWENKVLHKSMWWEISWEGLIWDALDVTSARSRMKV